MVRILFNRLIETFHFPSLPGRSSEKATRMLLLHGLRCVVYFMLHMF